MHVAFDVRYKTTNKKENTAASRHASKETTQTSKTIKPTT